MNVSIVRSNITYSTNACTSPLTAMTHSPDGCDNQLRFSSKLTTTTSQLTLTPARSANSIQSLMTVFPALLLQRTFMYLLIFWNGDVRLQENKKLRLDVTT